MSNSYDADDFDPIKDIAKSVSEEDLVRHQPPAEVWDKISMGITEPAEEHNVLDLSDRATRAPVEPEKTSTGSSGVSRRQLALVAAGAVLVAVILSVLNFDPFNLDPEDDPNTVYTATISNDDQPEPFDGSASVTLEIDDSPMIEINFDGDIPSDEPVELWILKADGSDLVSVGLVEPGDTAWLWPSGFSPAEYPLVALSVEPDDGDPSHSGRTFLFGELSTDS